MQKLKKRIFAFAMCMMLMLSMTVMAFAAENQDGTRTVDGLEVTITTDSDTYKEGEAIEYTVTYHNTNDYALSDVSVSWAFDSAIDYDKLELQKYKSIDSIGAGETVTQTFTTKGEAHSDGPDMIVIIAIAAAAVVVLLLVILIVALKKKKAKKAMSMIVAGTLLAGSFTGISSTQVQAAVSNSDYSYVSVHDPSIVKDSETGTYYIFGSHKAAAKSSDLMKWSNLSTNVATDFTNLFSDVWNNYVYDYVQGTDTAAPELTGNLWAPDVIWNDTMNKWCMYMSVNGNRWHSAIVLLTADDIEGPYEYVDEVIFSGFDGSSSGDIEQSTMNVSKAVNYNGNEETKLKLIIRFQPYSEAVTRADYSDIRQVLGLSDSDTIPARYNSTDQSKVNCIDPNVCYDENGDLWMTYGSWSAGIYQIKLDNETGLRDYDYTEYGDYVKDKADPYLGYKIAGGYYNSGEGPYILKAGDYYYLFLSLGNLETSGGYNMRYFRSESINGPYVDMNGNSAIYTGWDSTAGIVDLATNKTTSKYNSKRGIRVMSSIKMYGKSDTKVETAQGHNSAFVDDDGRIYLIYHTRYAGTSEAYTTKVHQMYVNEDGWLVVSPYEYSGEKLATTAYSAADIAGTYDLSIQYQAKVYVYGSTDSTLGIYDAQSITLSADGKITGDVTGTWKLTSGNNVEMVLGGKTYKGVFVKQANETDRAETLTFTLAGDNQLAWGAKTN